MVAQHSKDEMLYNEVQKRKIEAVRARHRSGAGLEWTDKEGRTPLILACTRGDSLEMILALLNLGANLNAYSPGFHGGTPLHHAAKRGYDKIVELLLHRGANPLVNNDDCETPLQMARTRGHVTVVRLIEGRISLFCGMIRKLSGRGFFEALAPQRVPKKIWAVVLPSASNNSRWPPRFELVIYTNPKVSQPQTIILLSKVEICEPKFSLQDPMLVLFDKSTKTTYKFLSETEGDKKQLRRFYEACKGIQQQRISATASEHPPLPEDVQLAMAIDASLLSLEQESIPFSGALQQGYLSNDFNGGGSMSGRGGNGWGPHQQRISVTASEYPPFPEDVQLSIAADASLQSATASEHPPLPEDVQLAIAIDASLQSATPAEHLRLPEEVQLAIAIDDSLQSWAQERIPLSGSPQQGCLTSDFNGLGSMSGSGGNGWRPPERAEMQINSDKCNGWGSSNIAEGQTTDSVSGPSVPENAFTAHSSISAPSAPPLPEEYTPGCGTEGHSAQPSTSSNRSQVISSGSCVICLDAPAEGVCIPCAHLAGCMACLNGVKQKKWGCPVCRASIEQVVKVYAVGLDT